jgi:hypothetical protein
MWPQPPQLLLLLLLLWRRRRAPPPPGPAATTRSPPAAAAQAGGGCQRHAWCGQPPPAACPGSKQPGPGPGPPRSLPHLVVPRLLQQLPPLVRPGWQHAPAVAQPVEDGLEVLWVPVDEQRAAALVPRAGQHAARDHGQPRAGLLQHRLSGGGEGRAAADVELDERHFGQRRQRSRAARLRGCAGCWEGSDGDHDQARTRGHAAPAEGKREAAPRACPRAASPCPATKSIVELPQLRTRLSPCLLAGAACRFLARQNRPIHSPAAPRAAASQHVGCEPPDGPPSPPSRAPSAPRWPSPRSSSCGTTPRPPPFTGFLARLITAAPRTSTSSSRPIRRRRLQVQPPAAAAAARGAQRGRRA